MSEFTKSSKTGQPHYLQDQKIDGNKDKANVGKSPAKNSKGN